MLRVDSLGGGPGFGLADVRCSHERGGWGEPEPAAGFSLVLLRRGVFSRQVEGGAEVIEPNVAYFQRARTEQRIAHPAAGGDRCLAVRLSADLVGVLARGPLPARAFATTPPAREALAADPRLGLSGLAARLGCSPDHLSRAFTQALGLSFTRHRRRLRVRLALERVADGEANLAWVAASAGFADHAHLTRCTRAELGITPAWARAQLAA